MNAQLKKSNKFSLAAGTTNRHQWHRKAVSALQDLSRLKTEQKELYGIIGGDERESIVSIMFGDITNQVAADLYAEIGERFGWLITKENADDITAAVLEALPVAREAMPVIDSRKSPEQVSEQRAARHEQETEREKAAAIKAAQVDIIKAELMALYPWAYADDGKISRYARASKNMKQELKRAFPYVQFSVTSNSFSMGNSISVSWGNGPTSEKVENIVNKYQYYINKFDNDNSAEACAVAVVLGQAKYVSCQRNIDDSIREQVKADIMKQAALDDWQASEFVWRALSCVDITGEYSGVELINGDYVAQFKAPEAIPAGDTLATSAAHIEEHEHTKHGFTMYMVVLDNRIERDEFNELRDKCKSMGGWYSRQWGKTPGGYAFKEQAQAVEFLNLIAGDTPPAPTGGGKPSPKQNGDKFRTMADKMQSDIDSKLAPRQENTAKRQAQAAHARLEGDKLKRTQSALYALADFQDSTGELPHILANISSKKAVYDLMSEKLTSVNNGYHGYSVGTGEMHDTLKDNPQAVALWALLKPKSHHEKQAEALAQKVRELQGCNIAGYFQTPAAVVDLMLEAACIHDYHAILEPSAGSGAICDKVADVLSDYGLIHCYEVNATLVDILTAKGYTMAGGDFMEAVNQQRIVQIYDRILMNPPFEKLQDCDHVRHAFRFLKPDGRLVAIMSPSFEFNSNKKAQDFRLWLDGLTYEVRDIPAGAFKESGTMIATKLLIIDKN